MNYIVLDLEWNQCPYGKAQENEQLPFEIIEIGAVRVNEAWEPTDRFREIVRPQVYRSLHFHTSEIVHISADDLKKARLFPEVFSDFMDWCGEDPRFCTWGPSDLLELQQNIAYHGIKNPFPFPLFYYDIQKIFSIAFEDGNKQRRSLKYAVEYLDIPEDIPFHDAWSDAVYTARIMCHLSDAQIVPNFSVDYFRTPANRRQEIYLKYSTYSKFISKPYPSKILAMKDKVVISTTCPECKRNAPKKLRWFSQNARNYYCISWCEQHGYLKGKIRLRQNRDGNYYAIKTVKAVSFEEALKIKERKGPKNSKKSI